VLDTSAPAAPVITGFASDSGTVGDHITNDNTLAISGTAEASSSVTVKDGAANTSVASAAYLVTIDTATPAAPVITTVTDDVAPVTGTVANNGFTNDTTPTLTGTAEANSMVTVKDGATV